MGWESDIEQDFGAGVSLPTLLMHLRSVIERNHDPTIHYDAAVVAWLDRTIEEIRE